MREEKPVSQSASQEVSAVKGTNNTKEYARLVLDSQLTHMPD